MACGDVTPSTNYVPTCGLSPAGITKRANPPPGTLLHKGDVITWSVTIDSRADGPAGVSFEDIIGDCGQLTGITFSAPWVATQDPLNPCRYTVVHATAVNPWIYTCVITATVAPMAMGTVSNTANLLTPYPVAGNTVTHIYGPTLEGDMPDLALGANGAFAYNITSGTGPFVVTLISGDLPDGLTLNTDGTVTGTTTETGEFSFILRVTDANANTFELSDDCTVSALQIMVPDELYNGEIEWVEAKGLTLNSITMT